MTRSYGVVTVGVRGACTGLYDVQYWSRTYMFNICTRTVDSGTFRGYLYRWSEDCSCVARKSDKPCQLRRWKVRRTVHNSPICPPKSPDFESFRLLPVGDIEEELKVFEEKLPVLKW